MGIQSQPHAKITANEKFAVKGKHCMQVIHPLLSEFSFFVALHHHTFCNVRLLRGEAMAVWIELRHRKTGFYSWPCLASTDTQLSPPDSPHWCCSRWELQDRGLQSPGAKPSSSLDAEERHQGLLVTKMATEGSTLPFSVCDSLPPSYIHFLSLLTCVSMCLCTSNAT